MAIGAVLLGKLHQGNKESQLPDWNHWLFQIDPWGSQLCHHELRLPRFWHLHCPAVCRQWQPGHQCHHIHVLSDPLQCCHPAGSLWVLWLWPSSDWTAFDLSRWDGRERSEVLYRGNWPGHYWPTTCTGGLFKSCTMFTHLMALCPLQPPKFILQVSIIDADFYFQSLKLP